MTLTFRNQYSFTAGSTSMWHTCASIARAAQAATASSPLVGSVSPRRIQHRLQRRRQLQPLLDLLRRMPEGRRDVDWRCSGLGEQLGLQTLSRKLVHTVPGSRIPMVRRQQFQELHPDPDPLTAPGLGGQTGVVRADRLIG